MERTGERERRDPAFSDAQGLGAVDYYYDYRLAYSIRPFRAAGSGRAAAAGVLGSAARKRGEGK